MVHSSSSDSNPSSQSLGLSTSFGARKIAMPGVAEDGPAPQAAITFRLKFKTSWGQGVKLIGSHASLGGPCMEPARRSPADEILYRATMACWLLLPRRRVVSGQGRRASMDRGRFLDSHSNSASRLCVRVQVCCH